MNAFVESRFTEKLTRVALGLEPLDSERRTRIAHPVAVTFDVAPPGRERPPVERHDSCLHVLRYYESSEDRVEMNISVAKGKHGTRRVGFPILPSSSIALRFDDPARRFVARRFSFPLLTATAADATPFNPGLRIRRPVLFPGAAYDVSGAATGLRGRVLRDGEPVRWARVEATIPGTTINVGRAHGDDRGEFLLLLAPGASPLDDLEDDKLEISVTAFAPALPPVPADPSVPELDPLWDLPLEEAAPPGQPDPVSAGEIIPPGYVSTLTSTLIVEFVLGKLQSGIDPFVIS